MSPVVVFRYRAKPTRLPVKQSSHSSEGTSDGGDDDDDQGKWMSDDVKVSLSRVPLCCTTIGRAKTYGHGWVTMFVLLKLTTSATVVADGGDDYYYNDQKEV